MKFNLKNFPKFKLDQFGDSDWEVCIQDWREDVEEWFEGFEKELREIDASLEKEGCTLLHRTRKIIKEILGE